MSDRARSSVRTETREGSGTPDGSPEAAGQDGDRSSVAARTQAAGATAVGSTPADTPSDAPPADATSREAAPAAPAAEPAAPAPGAEAKPAAPAPPAAHPVTPLAPAGARAAGEGARPVGNPAPAVPPATGVNRPAAGRGPAAGQAPIDSTQAVPLVTGNRPDPAARAVGRPADPASRPAAAEAAGRPGKARGVGRGPRRARLQLRHIDTWSALKISLVLSIALFFVWMVAVGVLYGVLSGLGVFDTLNDLIGQLSTASGEESGGGDVISAGIVFGGAAVIGAVNIVLLTALCTVTAFVYNLCSDLVGGLEVTLAERD